MLSIIVTFPFIWFNLNILYFAIILLIKDFFTIVFLIVQRDKFHNFKTDRLQLFTLLLAIIILPIYYTFGLQKIAILEPIGVVSNYQFWHLFSDAIMTLIRAEHINVVKYFMYPLSSAIIYASIASLYFEFSKKHKYFNALTSLGTTLIVVTLFHFNTSLEDAAFIGFFAFMFLVIYNLIIHSRRRFGILFGLCCFVIWTIDNSTLWSLTLISITVFTIYLVLKKPRPSIFFLQLLAPIVIIWALDIADFSVWLSIVMSIIVAIVYASVVLMVRIKWVEKTNPTFTHKYFRFIFLGSLFLVVVILNIVIVAKGEYQINNFYNGNNVFSDFKDLDLVKVDYIIYYIILALVTISTIFILIKRAKFNQTKLVIFISFMFFVLCFNPLMLSIFLKWIDYHSYQFIKFMAIMPLIIVFLGKIRLYKSNAMRMSKIER